MEFSRRDLLRTVRDLALAGVASQVLPGRVEAGGGSEAERKEIRIKTPAIVGAALLFTKLNTFSYIIPHGGVEGLSVELYLGSVEREGGSVTSFGNADFGPPVATTVTGKDGTFIFEGLEPRELYIVTLASVPQILGDEQFPFGYGNARYLTVTPKTQIVIATPFELGIRDLPADMRKRLGFYTVYTPITPTAP